MLTLNTKIERLASVGPSVKKTLNKLGIFYLEDLFFHLPFRYIDFTQKIPIGQAQVGQMVTLQGQLVSIASRRSFRSRLSFTEATLVDNTGEIKLIWFNQPYLAKQFKEGNQIIVAGKIDRFKTNQLTNPYFEIIDQENNSETGKIIPIYHLTAGITNLRLLKLVKLAYQSVQPMFVELIADKLLSKFKLPNLTEAISELHFPKSTSAINKARLRVAVEDVLPQQVAAQIKQKALDSSTAPDIKTDVEFIKSIIQELPWDLTNAQKRATWDILQDLSAGKPMNRLLEGDVGSGKTVVAMLAAAMTNQAGFQTLILAPTEILAKQHYKTFQKLLPQYAGQIGLLTSGIVLSGKNSASKDQWWEDAQSEQLGIMVGTHALLKQDLSLNKLGLIIIDEQHRFGVGQRAFLGKQHQSDMVPHLLSMSATPIPRTLALSLFGGLQISQLKSLPTGRQRITTQLFSESQRQTAYKKIASEIADGRQIFIITPKVEETDSAVKSVKAEYERLQKLFPKNRLGLVYGGLKSADKELVMNQFAEGKLDILVATTVIEIGIDVPNATVILIEGAENFGLAQLHQLRGRVGRGQHPSYCFLFTTDDQHLDNERLKSFETITDGFVLAEHDLAQRGFGDLFGQDQSGFNFRYPKFITLEALKLSQEIATDMLLLPANDEHKAQLIKLTKPYLEQVHLE